MNKEEINIELKQAFEKVNLPTGVQLPVSDPNWIYLFDYFNKVNNTTYSTGCRPCYPKVYYFIMKNIIK